jgi:regulator of protease activity HflC (stomatin/prohibitin superfamily)
MVPPIIVLWLVLRLGADFVKGVYGLSSADASAYLNTSLFGSLSGERLPEVTSKLALSWTLEELMGGEVGGGGPFVIVDNGAVQGRNSHDPAMRVGGPGSLIVSPDSAVLMERAGQLTRVVGPGVHPLRRFEKVRDVLNVRPLHHRTVRVNGMSREGIPVVWPVDVRYRIGDEGDGFHPATERQPYAFSEDAVLQASAARLMREPDASKHLDWGDLMAGAAEGILRGIMARYPLDRLLRRLYDAEALPRQEIESELESALLAFAASQGLILVQVDLQNIELEDPVAQQLVERWRADWTKLVTEELALGEAERAYQLQRIRSEAQGMLTAISEGLERWDGPPRSPAADIVSLRLIETLRHIVTQPHALGQMAYPPNLRQAWDRLRRLIASTTSGE